MPEIKRREGFSLIGVLQVGDPRTTDFHDFWMNEFMPREPELRPLSVDGAYYGAFLCSGRPEAMEMLAAMSVAPEAVVPEGLVMRQIPAATYAVFDCTLATLGPTWAQVESALREAAYTHGATPDFEYYPPDTNGPDSPVQIWVPVQKTP